MKIKALFILSFVALILTSSALGQERSYTNRKLGVSFRYPSDFRVKVDDGAEPTDFTITISPRHPQKNSNGDYHFAISKSALETNSAGTSEDSAKPPKGLPKTKLISGVRFKVFADSDAGAGQYYYSYGYRGWVKKSEWTIKYEEHTSPKENFEPKVHELNTSRGRGILSRLAKSVRVLK